MAQAEFEAGNYQDALDHFQRAYELTGSPILLYNIGQTADRLRLDATALRAFQLYLGSYPDAPNRDEVEHRMRALEPRVETETRALAAQTSERSAWLDEQPRSRVRLDVTETLLPSPYKAPSNAVASDPVASASITENGWFWVATGAITVCLVTTIVLVASTSSTSNASTSAGTAP